MLRSKSRSGYIEIEKNNHSSVISKTISKTKLCRGDALVSQIDTKAIQSLHRKPFKVVNLSENRIVEMQLQMGELEDELKRLKEQLVAAEEERDRANDELREMKIVAQEANMRLSEALPSQKVEEVILELNDLKQSLSNSQLKLEIKEKSVESLKLDLEKAKKSLSNSQHELEIQGKSVESLKLELEKAKQSELDWGEMDASLDRLKEELSIVKDSNTRLTDLLSESEKRIEELEAEAERAKQSESKMFDTLVSQTKELEQTKIELEESKLEVASLRDRLNKLEISSIQISSKDLDRSHVKEEFGGLKSELQLPKEKVASTEEGEEVASLKVNGPLEELDMLKNELKLALEAEERNKKAMDGLALALKEVAMEANQAKEKLGSTQVELGQLRLAVRISEERYRKLLDEAKQQVERYENTMERLRLEAEESSLAWNDKEKGFVSCIRKAEEERTSAQQENIKLSESLKAAQEMTRTSKEENHKLRDILKQALNEANVAKEAAAIARTENSHLKDCITEKDEALDFFTRENERLRIDDAAAHASIKELKRMLSMKLQNEDNRGGRFKSPLSVVEERIEGKHKHRTAISFDLHELKLLDEHQDVFKEVVYEDPEKAEALKGSIFDNNVDTPRSEPRTPKPVSHHRRKSSFMDDGDSTNSEELGHLDEFHSDDAENHQNSQKKMRAMLRRFGDLLIKKKGSHKKEPSIE